MPTAACDDGEKSNCNSRSYWDTFLRSIPSTKLLLWLLTFFFVAANSEHAFRDKDALIASILWNIHENNLMFCPLPSDNHYCMRYKLIKVFIDCHRAANKERNRSRLPGMRKAELINQRWVWKNCALTAWRSPPPVPLGRTSRAIPVHGPSRRLQRSVQ